MVVSSLKVEPNKNISSSKVLGFIKVGPKKLFLFDKAGRHHEMLPLCVLDFYVHEDFQRQGCGLKLFKFMLQVSTFSNLTSIIIKLKHQQKIKLLYEKINTINK